MIWAKIPKIRCFFKFVGPSKSSACAVVYRLLIVPGALPYLNPNLTDVWSNDLVTIHTCWLPEQIRPGIENMATGRHESHSNG